MHKNTSFQSRIYSKDSAEYKKEITAAFTRIDSLKKWIQSGDVITRTGNDFTSQSLRTLNKRDSTFSHCGIASIEQDTVFVYHALGGEWNPDAALKKEFFISFANPYDNNMLGVYRPNLKTDIRYNLIKTIQKYYGSKLRFDMNFDLASNDKMYCAEFVYKSFLNASDSTIKFHHSFIQTFEFVGIDDIFMDSIFKKIAIIKFRF